MSSEMNKSATPFKEEVPCDTHSFRSTKVKAALESGATILSKRVQNRIAVYDNKPRTRRNVKLRYASHLPPASELARCEMILPGSVDRIFKIVEAQNASRIEFEKITISSQQRQADRGQWLGFVIAIFAIISGLYAALKGQQWFGSVLCGWFLRSIVCAFIPSQVIRKEEQALSSQIACKKPFSPNPDEAEPP